MLYQNLILLPLQQMAENNFSKIVLQKGNKTTSAGLLYSNACMLATGLSERGLKEDDVVLLALPAEEEFLIIFYALLILRAKIAIIDNEMGSDLYSVKMQQLKPKWLFADSKLLLMNKYAFLRKIGARFRKNLPKLYFKDDVQIVATGINLNFFQRHQTLQNFFLKAADKKDLQPNDADYENIVIYTSGTLSEPKGVVHTNKSLNASLIKMEGLFFGDKNVVLATYLPHFILIGIACNFLVKILDPTMGAMKKLSWFSTEQITAFFGAPYDYLPLILVCEKMQAKFPTTLKHLIIGSAPVHKKFLNRLIAVLPKQTKITCIYGMTEHLVTALVDGREKITYTGEGDLLGKVVQDVQLKIGADGEFFVNSAQCFKKYLHQEESGAAHPTGDLGSFDGEANLVLHGRKKDMIIRRNFNIYPALYEDTIRKIPGVTETALVGIYSDEIFDEVVYLIVETEQESADDIYEKLQTGIYSIDSEALPDRIIKMQIPRLGRHQKIDKIKIREMIKAQSL